MTAPVLFDAMGPRGRRRVAIASATWVLILTGVVAVAVSRFASTGQLDWDRWSFFFQRPVMEFLLLGLVNTAKLAAVAMVAACAAGVFLGLARLSPRPLLRWSATAWIELFRGIPLVLLILYTFFALDVPQFDQHRRALVAAAVALSLYNSAILAEIVRAGVLSLDSGQTDAALAIGLTRRAAMRLVILPQALRRMVPAVVSQLVTLLKDTSLAYIIAYDELLRRFEDAAEGVPGPTASLQGYLLAAGVYVAINLALSRLARRLEARQRRRYGAGDIQVAGMEDTTAAVGMTRGV